MPNDPDFSYDSTLAADKDKVRFLLGDTDIDFPIFGDNEILAGLTVYTTVSNTAAALAEVAAAQYARMPTLTIGDFSIDMGSIAAAFTELANKLRRAAAGVGGLGMPYAGGLSVGEMTSDLGNPDLPTLPFRMGLFDGPQPTDPAILSSYIT